MAQEGLHSMKSRNLKGAILKIDLSKAYDKVSWLYIHMLLIHLGFRIAFVRWIMSCITTVSFSVLIPLLSCGERIEAGLPLVSFTHPACG